jgi:hypothetical protein
MVDKLVIGIFSEKTILQVEAQAKVNLLGGGHAVAHASVTNRLISIAVHKLQRFGVSSGSRATPMVRLLLG